MKTRALSSAAVAAGLVLAVAASAGARGQATQIRLAVTMNAAQEVPAPKGEVGAARGTFTATVSSSATGAAVAWRLTFEGLTGNAVAAHIHVGPRGESGPVVLALCGPCESGATGTGNLSAESLAALQAGRTYVNVHTPQNPAGEIRGQTAVVAAVRAALVPGQERPRPRGVPANARGLFTGTVTKTGAEARLAWRLTFSRLSGRAVAAHIHVGARGRTGPVAIALCGPCRSGVRKTTTLSAAVQRALEAGRAYVNVHTKRNPAGEVRGQLPAAALTLN